MDAQVRRHVEMGRRALLFCREYPDESRGYQTSVERLAGLIERGEQLLRQQQEGMLEVRAAARRKVDLRRKLKLVHLAHLSSVAKAASRELPELHLKFVFPPNAKSFRAFRTAAGSMLAEAERHRGLLDRYGLDEVVVHDTVESLAQFDDASARVNSGRMAHVGARTDLRVVAREILLAVKVLDGGNLRRFPVNGEALASWNSASRVQKAERAEEAERAEGVDEMAGPGLEPAA